MAGTNRINVDLDILDYYDGKIKDYVDDKVGTGGLTIDTVLSDTSTNPVQNKVIKAALDEKADKAVATTTADGLMSAVDKTKLDDAGNTYALKSKYGDTTIDVGRKIATAVGGHSTAEGFSTTASGSCSHAEGSATTASGYYSHAEGNATTASGYYSHAEGNATTASGNSSHAEGDSTTASGSCSHAGGRCTKALNMNEVAYGQYNESNDDTLFSVGDGTSDSARHNAFEITKTGGKLHDKDIATTDIIPDLSEYAKKTDVPNIKVNAAVDADTVGGLKANQFVLGAAIVQLTTSINEYYTAGTASVEAQYTPDFPVGYGSFGLLDVRVYGSIVYQTIRFENGKIIHRARVLVATDWTAWAEIYTSGNKPYVTGSATVEANSQICVTNHGFIPAAVIWWDSTGSNGVAVSFDDLKFIINVISTDERTINYLIFK